MGPCERRRASLKHFKQNLAVGLLDFALDCSEVEMRSRESDDRKIVLGLVAACTAGALIVLTQIVVTAWPLMMGGQ